MRFFFVDDSLTSAWIYLFAISWHKNEISDTFLVVDKIAIYTWKKDFGKWKKKRITFTEDKMSLIFLSSFMLSAWRAHFGLNYTAHNKIAHSSHESHGCKLRCCSHFKTYKMLKIPLNSITNRRKMTKKSYLFTSVYPIEMRAMQFITSVFWSFLLFVW